MLAFLHTARTHVETFARLARTLDGTIPVRHEVQERLLAGALAAGGISHDVRTSTARVIESLAHDGAKVIVCTCSTIGGVAEACSVPDCSVMRIDRPMAEQAVASGRRIIVLAALQSTFQASSSLLREIASHAQRSVEIVEILSEGAWPLFELGDLAGYAAAVAKTIELAVLPSDLVVLAQASMAPAAELVRHLGIPVLSSPSPAWKLLYRDTDGAQRACKNARTSPRARALAIPVERRPLVSSPKRTAHEWLGKRPLSRFKRQLPKTASFFTFDGFVSGYALRLPSGLLGVSR